MSVESLISATDSSITSEPISVPTAHLVVGESDAPFVTTKEPQIDAKPTKKLNRRTEFFLTSIFFQVEDKVYSVPEMLFPGVGYLKSAVGGGVGTVEEDPLQLDVTVSQMDSLMSVLLDRRVNSPLELTISQWGDALGLATQWNLEAARSFIIEQINRHFPNHLADRIRLADAYNVGSWLQPAYEKLCTRPDPPTEDEIAILGAKRLAALWKIREACRQPQVSQQKVIRATCQSCQEVWVFDASESAEPETLRCGCGYYISRDGCPQSPRDLPTPTTNAAQLVKASIVLKIIPDHEEAVTDNVDGSPPDGSQAVELAGIAPEAHVSSLSRHEYVCHPKATASVLQRWGRAPEVGNL
ncbi:hypothetical protein FRB98_003883, partial [Tulasnella sp. 332]